MCRATPTSGSFGATLEAHPFLIAAFCRLAKSVSHSEQIGWMVGAVGIELTVLSTAPGLQSGRYLEQVADYFDRLDSNRANRRQNAVDRNAPRRDR